MASYRAGRAQKKRDQARSTPSARRQAAGRQRRAGRGEEFGGRLPVALIYPGDTAAALSALGWQEVYRLLAARPGLAVERFVVPAGVQGLASEESGRGIDVFPVLAFSLTFELDLLALARVLNIASLLHPRQRPDLPILLGGGPLAFLNPAPLAGVLDLIYCGEAGDDLGDLLLEIKDRLLAGQGKPEVLAALAGRPGIYVPGISALPVARRVGQEPPGVLESPACSAFVSSQAAFKDMFLVEINRGCPHACRFCAAGFVYRPPRQADMAALKQRITAAKPGKVGLVGTALTDWEDLPAFLSWLAAEKIKFSLSSLRASGLTAELLAVIRASGSRTLTLALEAPSARLRRAANKHLDADTFLAALRLCAEAGVNHVKVYLIVGWPGETPDDYREFADMAGDMARAARLGDKGKKAVGRMTIAASALVPKPFTPMQFAPMATETALTAAFDRLRQAVKDIPGMRVEADPPLLARVQGIFARGGEEVFGLAELALKFGGSWKQALAAWDGDVVGILERERGEGEVFPWEVIDVGVRRTFLLREWRRYKRAVESPICPRDGCGACKACGMAEFLAQGQRSREESE